MLCILSERHILWFTDTQSAKQQKHSFKIKWILCWHHKVRLVAVLEFEIISHNLLQHMVVAQLSRSSRCLISYYSSPVQTSCSCWLRSRVKSWPWRRQSTEQCHPIVSCCVRLQLMGQRGCGVLEVISKGEIKKHQKNPSAEEDRVFMILTNYQFQI